MRWSRTYTCEASRLGNFDGLRYALWLSVAIYRINPDCYHSTRLFTDLPLIHAHWKQFFVNSNRIFLPPRFGRISHNSPKASSVCRRFRYSIFWTRDKLTCHLCRRLKYTTGINAHQRVSDEDRQAYIPSPQSQTSGEGPGRRKAALPVHVKPIKKKSLLIGVKDIRKEIKKK